MIRQIESILGVDMGWLVTAFSSIMILAYLFFMLACLIAAITLIIMYRRQITFQPGQWPLRKGRAMLLFECGDDCLFCHMLRFVYIKLVIYTGALM